MMNTNFAVVLGIVYSYLPFMILPLYANLERLDRTLNEAAMDLGSKPWQVFKDVTLPLVDARHHRRRACSSSFRRPASCHPLLHGPRRQPDDRPRDQ